MKPLFEKPSVPEGQSWAFLNRRLDDEIPFQWHYHREYELTLTLNSRGQRFVGDHFGPYDDGDLVLLGPNLPHTWASAAKVDDTAPHVALVMWFRPEWIDAMLDHAAELARIAPLLKASRRGIRFSADVAGAVRAMVEAMEELPPSRRLFNLLDILVHIAGDQEMAPLASPAFQQSAFEASARPRIERVLDHIHAHYKERLTINALAELCHLSASGLQRMFKRHTRMTIFEYMAQLRSRAGLSDSHRDGAADRADRRSGRLRQPIALQSAVPFAEAPDSARVPTKLRRCGKAIRRTHAAARSRRQRLMAAMKSRTSSISRRQPLDQLEVVGPRLDLGDAVGDGEGADAAGRTLEVVRQPQPLARRCIGNLVAGRERLMDEELQNFLLQRTIAERLLGKMGKVDRTGT